MATNSSSEKLFYEEVTELLRQAEESHRANSVRANDSTRSLENIVSVGKNDPNPNSVIQVIEQNYTHEEFNQLFKEAKSYVQQIPIGANTPTKLDCYYHAIKNLFGLEEFNAIMEEAKKIDEALKEELPKPIPVTIDKSTPQSNVTIYRSPIEIYAGLESHASTIPSFNKESSIKSKVPRGPLYYDITPFFNRHWKGLTITGAIGATILAAALYLNDSDKSHEKYRPVETNNIALTEKVHYKD